MHYALCSFGYQPYWPYDGPAWIQRIFKNMHYNRMYYLLQLLLYFLPMSGVSGGVKVEILPGNRPDDPLLSWFWPIGVSIGPLESDWMDKTMGEIWNLVQVSSISFDHKVMQRTFSFPLVPIVGTGLRLELNKVLTFCILGIPEFTTKIVLYG